MTKRVVYSVQAAMAAGLMCVLAPISIPLGAVPLTLGSFCVYLIAALFPPWYACEAVGIYLLLGCCGLPIFAGFSGGVGVLVGPTGGFLLGYLPAVVIAAYGLRCGIWSRRRCIGMFAASALCINGCGTVWYMVTAQVSFVSAVTVCVLPFVVGECVKMIGAYALCQRLSGHIQKVL